ncbi:MAG: DUF1573 domain-containing protein [Limisphaerales bacterium]
MATPPVYVPDLSHANEPLPDGIIAWENPSQAIDAAADQGKVNFTFNFTNASPGNIVVLSVHPSCGCTTPHLPPLPWTLPSGANGQIGLTVDIAGKSGTLFKNGKSFDRQRQQRPHASHQYFAAGGSDDD